MGMDLRRGGGEGGGGGSSRQSNCGDIAWEMATVLLAPSGYCSHQSKRWKLQHRIDVKTPGGSDEVTLGTACNHHSAEVRCCQCNV